MIVKLRLRHLRLPGVGSRAVQSPAEPPRPATELRQVDAEEVLRALSTADAERKLPDANLVTPREMAHGLTHMLTPACAIAYALALWRIGEDMGWARDFAIRQGLFSHWQVWFGLGIGLQMTIYELRRRFRNDDDQDQATP
jgi:hypothetical protein